MKAKVKFVRFRWRNGERPPMVDIVYRSGRCVSIGEEDIPKTVKAFLRTAKTSCDFDCLWGFEIIYS